MKIASVNAIEEEARYVTRVAIIVRKLLKKLTGSQLRAACANIAHHLERLERVSEPLRHAVESVRLIAESETEYVLVRAMEVITVATLSVRGFAQDLAKA